MIENLALALVVMVIIQTRNLASLHILENFIFHSFTQVTNLSYEFQGGGLVGM